MDDPLLRYHHLAAFDREMASFALRSGIPFGQEIFLLHLDEGGRILAFLRGKQVFVFNFHPDHAAVDYWIPAAPGVYRVELDTDRAAYGGLERQDPELAHHTLTDRIHRHFLSLYLPSRTAVVFEPLEDRSPPA
jgi:1,4-alpha-glucan branching enzyme